MDKELERLYIKEFTPNTILFVEGEPGNTMYIVKEGEVQLSRKIAKKNILIATIQEGGFFGEMSLLLERPRTATAIVTKLSKLLIIKKNELTQILQSQPHIAEKMLRELTERLYRANKQIEALFMEDNTYKVMLTLYYHYQEYGLKESAGIFIPISLHQLSDFTGLTLGETSLIVEKLIQAEIIMPRSIGSKEGYLISDQKRFEDFLIFLEDKEKF